MYFFETCKVQATSAAADDSKEIETVLFGALLRDCLRFTINRLLSK